ncbi:MAG TPA: radical SAM protein, partial [Deltaproteobacteria bacterium]|nr:radical SAM protein [Deltaproteobacteria bacterium]
GVRPTHPSWTPDYDAFRDLPYLSPGFVLPFAASTGCCWGRCSFCPERAEQNRYACIPPGDVPAQVGDLCGRYAPSLVHFTDNAMSPALLAAMAGSGLDTPWYGFARLTPHLADPDFCRALRRSGCAMLQLGLESGDQAVLDSLDKGIRLEDASRALRTLHGAGIGTYVYLLFGTPAEDEQSARTTLEYVASHAAYIDFLNLSIFNLPRYGDEAGSLETYDFTDGDLSLYQGFTHPRGWERNLVRRFLDREFRRHPAIAGIVRNDPPFFTSNHAPFFC